MITILLTHAGLEILVITESKNKRIDIEKMNKEHKIIHRGVEKNKRAAGGIACLIHKKLECKIEDWKAWSERVMSVRIKSEDKKQ